MLKAGVPMLKSTWNNPCMYQMPSKQISSYLNKNNSYYFSLLLTLICSSEYTEFPPLPRYTGQTNNYSDTLFFVTIPTCQSDLTTL